MAMRHAAALGARHILVASTSSSYSCIVPRRHMSMDAGVAMEKIRAAGLLRTGGLIGGKWVDAYGGKTIEVQNPATGEVLANVACMGSKETSDAITSAHNTFYYEGEDNRSCFYEIFANQSVRALESGMRILELIVQLWSQSFA